MTVVADVVVVNTVNTVAVQLLLGVIVHIIHYMINGGISLGGMTTVADIRHFVIALGSEGGAGDILTVDAGEQETAAMKLKIPVHRKENAAHIGACQNTAGFVGFNVYHIVQLRVFSFKGNAKIRKQTQTETLGCLGVKYNGQLGQICHHAQIFEQFLCRKIHYTICMEFVDH